MKHQEVVAASDRLVGSISSLWVERYRPKVFDDIILSEENRSIFLKYKEQGYISNLLIAGNAGIGKTSLARVLVKDVLGCQYLYINASDENGIDTIRTKVTSFSRIMSLDGKSKVIILDECDMLSPNAQCALRSVMEEYTEHTRFILTANYKHKIIPAIQSRCQSFDLTPPLDNCIERVQFILDKEGIADTSEEQITAHVKQYYPDFRKCINELQKLTITGTLKKSTNNKSFIDALYKVLKSKAIEKARRYIIENEDRFGSDYVNLLRDLFNKVEADQDIDADKKRMCLITIAEYMYRSAFVADQEINFYACMLAVSVQL